MHAARAVTLILMSTALLTACESGGRYSKNDVGSRALVGGLIGAGLGAGIGAATGAGALVGAGYGAGAGMLIGIISE